MKTCTNGGQAAVAGLKRGDYHTIIPKFRTNNNYQIALEEASEWFFERETSSGFLELVKDMRENRKHIYLGTYKSFVYEIQLGNQNLRAFIKIKFTEKATKIDFARLFMFTEEHKQLRIDEDGPDDQSFSRAGIRYTDEILAKLYLYAFMLKELTMF